MKHQPITPAYISEFFQNLADLYVNGSDQKLADIYELPSAHCYEDGMRVASTPSELEVEHALLNKLLAKMRVARVHAKVEKSTDTRDNFLPVSVTYKLIDWDGSVVRDVSSQYYCKVEAPDRMRIAFTSCTLSRSYMEQCIAA